MSRIDVLEDSDDLRELMESALAGRGHAVRAYSTLAEAEAGVRADPPELFLCDVVLPDGDGVDLVGRLRAAGLAFPVLLVSGASEEGDIMRGFDAGATDFISKPFSIAELFAKCTLHLARGHRAPATPPAAEGDLPGGRERAFGRYRVQAELGRGASGVVYRALDLDRGEAPVALKVLGVAAALDPDQRARFLRETLALSSVDSPHVVRVHDVGALEGRLYYAMDLIEGPTLAAWVRARGPLSARQTRTLLERLARALEALGARGLLHRDLKPGNIMLRGGDPAAPVLIDFGLARNAQDRSLTADGVVCGTLGYLAPELLLGGTGDGRSDAFSLGLVGLFALTGHDPFPELRGLELLRAIVSRPAPLPAAATGPLREVLARMTSLEPADRFASPLDLRAALRACAPVGAGEGA